MSYGHWQDVIGAAEEAMQMKIPRELKERMARRADRIATSGPHFLHEYQEQKAVQFLGNVIERYVKLTRAQMN